jgi:hypothetical protein
LNGQAYFDLFNQYSIPSFTGVFDTGDQDQIQAMTVELGGYAPKVGLNSIEWTTKETQSFQLVAEIVNSPSVTKDGVLTTEIEPSIYPSCGKLSEVHNKVKVKIKCLDLKTNSEVEGCQYTLDLAHNNEHFDGGHTNGLHIYSRPLAQSISPENAQTSYIPLPKEGDLIELEVPQVSGEFDIILKGKTLDNKSIDETIVRVQVKTPGFISMKDLNIRFDTSEPVNSHTEGVYGDQRIKSELQLLISSFNKRVQDRLNIQPPKLESEAASLPWGGIYDISRNWLHPHCGHRDGRTLDLSLSIFNNYDEATKLELKDILADVIAKSNFAFTWYLESPTSNADHWHMQLQ